MEAAFWHARWQAGRIGFHRDEVMPLLARHWPALALPAGSRVLVPLAGKSLDMHWLADQGHQVLGVELSALAIGQFFDEAGLTPSRVQAAYGTHYRAGDIDLVCADAFTLPPALLADCAGVYDRAAMIALPAPLRSRYMRTVYARLPAGCRGLLITLEHPPHEKQGPPFPVDPLEVRTRFVPPWQVRELARHDILARETSFQAAGVTALHTAVYRLDRGAD